LNDLEEQRKYHWQSALALWRW